jgi:hypothetical protein
MAISGSKLGRNDRTSQVAQAQIIVPADSGVI